MLKHLAESDILDNHLNKMIDTAIQIYNDMKSKNELRDKYKIKNEIIHTKDNDGKFVSTTWFDYEDSFYYLKLIYEEYKNFKQVPLNEDCFGYLSVRCGLISYSELPNSYHGIFGVSGSLSKLSIGEKSLLTYYNIDKRSYYPSFFGGSKLEFNIIRDFIIKECENDWFYMIVTNAQRKIKEDRSVLIFFDNEMLLKEFWNDYSRDFDFAPFYITQNEIFDGENKLQYNDVCVDKLIKDEYAGHHRRVTLLTKVFGRGVDFQAETKVNKNGGIHVIQTFFSLDIKEEIQIKGRTARKDDPGSYELILCLKHLEKSELAEMNTSKFRNVKKDTSYNDLDKQRNKLFDDYCRNKLEKIKTNRERHQRTISFFQRAITKLNNNNREEFIKEIKNLN